MIMAWHRSNQTSKRLHYIPGVGPMLATALVASVANPRTFRSGGNFSAWIGLVPKQHSSGGKDGSAASANRVTAICAACSWPVGRPGNPYDNAKAESFMKTLKNEEVYLGGYETFTDVIHALPHFIDEVYNKRRLHSALDYRSPIEFEVQHADQAVNSMP